MIRRIAQGEPVRVVSVILALVLAVVTTLLGEGVISEALAGRITDLATALAGFLVLLLPVIAGEIARPLVTPVAQPSLPVGTIVTDPERPGVNRVQPVKL